MPPTLTSATTRFNPTFAVSMLTAAAIATTGLGAAPAAHATCASFFGIGNSADCTSTPLSVALAIGAGAQANATGLFGAAFALGTGASAKSPGLFSVASAVGTGARAEAKGTFGAALTTGANAVTETKDVFTLATALGENSLALGAGAFGIAAVLGPYTYAGTSGDPTRGNLGFNIAVNVSPANKLTYSYNASGIGNVAVNLFGTSDNPSGKFSYAYGLGNTVANLGGRRTELTAYGVLNNASNVFGTDNTVIAGADLKSTLNAAFTVFGSGNRVNAGPGPVAVAGSIAQTNQTVAKTKPGFNINGIRVPNTAGATNPQPAGAVTRRSAARPSGAQAESPASTTAKTAATQVKSGNSAGPKPAASQRASSR